ncbi:uncharacterized protein [Miscanthus floridulus]|uniref:uncharacterized protein n=1 Tax=Miscanthus floridulus TaxID=154761 RepID=UPI00345A060E
MTTPAKVLNADESALMNEWHPYCYAPDVVYSSTLKEASWEVEKLVLQVTPSMVALVSFSGDTQHFACSGTIVELSDGIILIVTVVNLLKHQDADVLAEKLKINVYLQNDEVTNGDLLIYDFYHNICLIKTKIVRPLRRPENCKMM